MRTELLWTSEQVALLRKLWAEGATAVVIGARLGGISRSAVLGKIFRLRLPFAASEAAGKRTSVAPGLVAAFPARRRRRPRREPPAPVNDRQQKTLFELTNKTCRWPHGCPRTKTFFFCGAPEADLEGGIPYCAHHMLRAYSSEARIEKAAAVFKQGAAAPGIVP
jgi:GcrA cell cycle regulator